jgi:hypothetical protein
MFFFTFFVVSCLSCHHSNSPSINLLCLPYAAGQYYPGIYLEELRKTTKNFNQVSQCPSQDVNQAPPQYESTALLLCQFTQYHQQC